MFAWKFARSENVDLRTEASPRRPPLSRFALFSPICKIIGAQRESYRSKGILDSHFCFPLRTMQKLGPVPDPISRPSQVAK